MKTAWVRDTINDEVHEQLAKVVDVVFGYRSGVEHPPFSDEVIRERMNGLMKTVLRYDTEPSRWFKNESAWAVHAKALELALVHEDANPIDRAQRAAEDQRGKIRNAIAIYKSQLFCKPSRQRVSDQLHRWARATLANITIGGRPPGSVYATTFLNRMSEIIMDECKDY